MGFGIQNTKYLKKNTAEYISNTFWNTRKSATSFVWNEFLNLYSGNFTVFSFWKNIFYFNGKVGLFFRIHLEKLKVEVVLDSLFLYSVVYSILNIIVFQVYSALYILYSRTSITGTGRP